MLAVSSLGLTVDDLYPCIAGSPFRTCPIKNEFPCSPLANQLVRFPRILPRPEQAVKSFQAECHSNMRSSHYGKVESSCSRPAHWPDERTGDVGVKHERSGSVEGVARSEARARQPLNPALPYRDSAHTAGRSVTHWLGASLVWGASTVFAGVQIPRRRGHTDSTERRVRCRHDPSENYG